MLSHGTLPSSSAPVDQSQSSPPFNLGIPESSASEALTKFKSIITEDFIDHEKLIAWWRELAINEVQNSYLNSTSQKMKIVLGLFGGSIELQNRYAVGILTLWKDARSLARKDFFYDELKSYYAEHPVPATTVPGILKQSEKVKTERSLQPTEAKRLGSSFSLDPWDTICWLHQDGSQIPYSYDVRKTILEAYRKNEKEVTVVIGDDTYTICFDSFTEKSMKTDMVRPIFLGNIGAIPRRPFSQKVRGFTLETFTHSPPIEVKRDEQGYFPVDASVAVKINPHDPQTWFIPSRAISQSPDWIMFQLVSLHQALSKYEVDQVFVILNPPLFAEYSNFRKQSFEKSAETGEIVQERTLFHGTAKENVTSISKNGFDVSRATRCNYGKGVYFARSQILAAQTEYSIPTEQNQQYIIAAKVVVGSCVVGNKEMDTPSPKPASGMVDKLLEWTVFASPHKHQAYPAMVIAFSPKLPELNEVKGAREEEEIKHATSDSGQVSKKRKEDQQEEGSRKKQTGQTSSSSTASYSSSSSSSQTTTSGSTESLSSISSSTPSLEKKDVTDQELVIAFREALQFGLERRLEDMEEWKKLDITEQKMRVLLEKFAKESKKAFSILKSRTTVMQSSQDKIGKLFKYMNVARGRGFRDYFEQKDSDKRLKGSSLDEFKAFMDSIEKLTRQDEVQQESALSAPSSSVTTAPAVSHPVYGAPGFDYALDPWGRGYFYKPQFFSYYCPASYYSFPGYSMPGIPLVVPSPAALLPAPVASSSGSSTMTTSTTTSSTPSSGVSSLGMFASSASSTSLSSSASSSRSSPSLFQS